MIDATKFSHGLGIAKLKEGEKYFRFGATNPEEAFKQLRDFADKIDQGLISVQQVETGQKATRDDFSIACFYIEFAEASVKDAN